MSNYLEEVKIKQERKETLESLIGKKAFVLCGEKCISSLTTKIDEYYCLYLKQITIQYIDKYCNVIGFSDDNKEFIIAEGIVEDIVILELKYLKDILERLFIKRESINVANISELNSKMSFNLVCTKEINLDTFFILGNVNSRDYYYFKDIKHSRKNESNISYLVTKLRDDINDKNPLLLSFNKDKHMISIVKTTTTCAEGIIIGDSKIESIESFRGGFYYGLDEVTNIIEDISDYYQEYFTEKTIFKKFLEKIFSF